MLTSGQSYQKALAYSLYELFTASTPLQARPDASGTVELYAL